MGRNAHPTIEENVSGSLSEQRHPNKSATPIYSEITSPVTQARNDDKGNLKDNHNAQTTPDGVIGGSKTHPTAEENDYRVGISAHQNAAGVDNENVSGNLKNDHLTAQTTPDGVAVGKNAHPIKEAPTLSGSLKENTPLDLPELNAQNWHIIVQKLTPELGANVLLAQHSSLVKVEDNQITLSVHKSGELFCKPAHLSALGEVLAHHYGTQKNIQVIEWQDNFESASQAKQRHKEEQLQQRLQTLQQDPFAQKLQQVFGGEWTVK
ncbi:MAG: hypothetical protein IJM09_03465 [Neisseriaceae bacterium]|nr:hypothetical protein [Neisseriaceae bacterium]